MEMKEAEPGKIIAACSHSSPVSDGVDHEILGEENSPKKMGDMVLQGPGCQHGYQRTIGNGKAIYCSIRYQGN